MAIVVKFDVNGMEAAKYAQIMAELDKIGLNAPAGRKYHVCFGDKSSLQVVDVFESPSHLDAFGAKLMPILQKYGVNAKPEVVEVHNIVVGK